MCVRDCDIRRYSCARGAGLDHVPAYIYIRQLVFTRISCPHVCRSQCLFTYINLCSHVYAWLLTCNSSCSHVCISQRLFTYVSLCSHVHARLLKCSHFCMSQHLFTYVSLCSHVYVATFIHMCQLMFTCVCRTSPVYSPRRNSFRKEYGFRTADVSCCTGKSSTLHEYDSHHMYTHT
jgi:hypothetical protein